MFLEDIESFFLCQQLYIVLLKHFEVHDVFLNVVMNTHDVTKHQN